MTASIEHRPSPAFSLSAAAGAVLSGRIGVAGAYRDIDPGPVLSLGGSWRVAGGGDEPFVMFSAGLSASTVQTSRLVGGGGERDRLTALDARFGLIAGVTLLGRLSPYAVVRAFGGPVWWALAGETFTGTDAYHYQVGAGLSASLPAGLDLFAEGVPLGEKRLSAGVGYSF